MHAFLSFSGNAGILTQMRTYEDFAGHRVIIVTGKYKGKKPHVSSASIFGIFVDLDYKPLRVLVIPSQIRILDKYGKVDKK